MDKVPPLIAAQIKGIADGIEIIYEFGYQAGFQAGLKESEKWRFDEKNKV